MMHERFVSIYISIRKVNYCASCNNEYKKVVSILVFKTFCVMHLKIAKID